MSKPNSELITKRSELSRTMSFTEMDTNLEQLKLVIDQSNDNLDIRLRQNLKRLAAEAGFNLVEGSFEEGAVISSWPDVVWYQADGKYYQWHLDEAKTVAVGSTPTNIGTDWIDKSGETLRSDINIVQKRFACVADMVADTTLVVGQIVEWIGYHNGWAATAEKPKGGNRAEIVAAGTGTDDGGSLITLSNGLQAKGLFISGSACPTQFGAYFDGSNDDSTAWQSAVNYSNIIDCFADNKTLIDNIVDIPRRGVQINLNGCELHSTSGCFRRSFTQVSNTTFKANYPALDDYGSYFYPIVINGGKVFQGGSGEFVNIRQPFLYANSQQVRTLIVNDTIIRMYGTATAFSINGGWGFSFNSIDVSGDTANPTNTTFLKTSPDGTYSASSHPQAFSINNSQIAYCKYFNCVKNTCTNSLEDIEITGSKLIFGEFGSIDTANLIDIKGGMIITNVGDGIINDSSNITIEGYFQRYHNSAVDTRRGVITFTGSTSSIKINSVNGACFSDGGVGLFGALFTFIVEDGDELLDADFSRIYNYGKTVALLSQTDPYQTLSVIRIIATGTGKLTNITFDRITGRSLHNIVDVNEIATPTNFNRLNLQKINAIGASVARRCLGITNAQQINAPGMYWKGLVKHAGSSVYSASAGVHPVCAYIRLPIGMRGAVVASSSGFSSTSNAYSMYYDSINDAGDILIAVTQNDTITTPLPVVCSAVFTFNSSESI